MIRLATLDDLDLLMIMAEQMHRESPRFSRLSFNFDKVLALFVRLIERDDCLLLVAENDGHIVGALAGFVVPHWFSDDLTANEYGVFVDPMHRGGMVAPRLIKRFVEWSQEKGAKLIQLGISTGIQTEQTVELYKRLGLKLATYGFEV